LVAITLTTAATAALATTDAKTKTTTVQSPQSVECSKKADAKRLHGKERKKFRAECKKEMSTKASSSSSSTPSASGAAKTTPPPPATKN
jgi:hypothetical protein